MIPVQQLKLTNLGGGANEKVAGHLIADNQSARFDSSTYPLMNVHTNVSGSLVKRSGYSVHTGPIVGSFADVITNGGFETWTGLTDLLTDGGLENWASSSNLTSWTEFGAGATFAQEGTIKKAGSYSCKITRAGALSYIYQDIGSPSSYDGKTVVLGGWVKTSVSNSARLKISTTPAASYLSSYHTGSGDWEYLSVVATLGTSLTILRASTPVDQDGDVYVDDLKLYEQLAPTDWTLSGTGATVSREEGTVKVGTYSAKVTAPAGNAVFLTQNISTALGGDGVFEGKSVTFGIWAYSLVANKAFIYLYATGGTGTFSSVTAHGGTGWEYLTTTGTVPADAAIVYAYCQVATSATAYFDGATVKENFTLSRINGLFEYGKFSGNKFDIAFGDYGTSHLAVDISTPASPVNITGEADLTASSFLDSCVVADKLIVTSEAYDKPVFWDGTGSFETLKEVVDGSPDVTNYAPEGKYCEEFFNYAFIANTSANPERVYWSGLFDPTSWTLTDFKRLSDGCTGMARRGDHLFLFTRNSITLCQYTGDSVNPFQFDVLDSGIGCVSNRTIKNIEGVLFWLSGDGHIYRMAGFKPERLTEAIPKTIASLNVSGFDIACAEDHKELRQYWCAVTKDGSTVNDFIFAYDYFNNEIFLYRGMNVLSFFNIADSNGQIKTYFGDNTGRVMLTNNGDADYLANVKTAIEWWKFSKLFDFGNPAITKRIRRLKVTANNAGNFTSQCSVLGDFGATGGTSVTISHNGGGDLLGSTWVLGVSRLGRVSGVASREDLAFNAKYVQLKFSGNAYDQPVEIRDAELMFQEYDQDRF